jgi:delta24(24(1))-sterol reductase
MPISFDTSMSQKSRFRMQMQGITTFRNAFPQLPWSIIKEPTFIQTEHGNRLLTSGWWAYARKIVSPVSHLKSTFTQSSIRTTLQIGSSHSPGASPSALLRQFPTSTQSSSSLSWFTVAVVTSRGMFIHLLTAHPKLMVLRCSMKYGEDWKKYCEVVKYKFIPGVY